MPASLTPCSSIPAGLQQVESSYRQLQRLHLHFSLPRQSALDLTVLPRGLLADPATSQTCQAFGHIRTTAKLYNGSTSSGSCPPLTASRPLPLFISVKPVCSLLYLNIKPEDKKIGGGVKVKKQWLHLIKDISRDWRDGSAAFLEDPSSVPSSHNSLRN